MLRRFNGRVGRGRLRAKPWHVLALLTLAGVGGAVWVVGCSPEQPNDPAHAGAPPYSNTAITKPGPIPNPLPPTPAQQAGLIDRVLTGDACTEYDAVIARYFQNEYIAPLSAASKAAKDALVAELIGLGILLYEVDERWDELVTPTTPAFQAFVAELEPLLEFDTLGKDGGITLAGAAAAVAAVASASACSDDAIDNQRLCSRQECPPGTDRFAVIECCGDEAKADIFWCFATAGVNGPDPEYNPNCCHPDN